MNKPLINLQDYDHTGLLFNGIGCLFWVLAYALLVYEIRRKKFVEMPAYIAGANIGWELVWGFIYHPDTGLLYEWSYKAAFLLDCFIFYSIMRYGTKQPMNAESRRHFLLFCGVNFLFWVLFSITLFRDGYDTPIGAYSGFIINVILSLQCIFMLFQTGETERFSVLFAWCRMLGTALISVSLWFFYPKNESMKLLGIACFILDSVYIYVLWKRHGRLI
jgi:hypothetical protein